MVLLQKGRFVFDCVEVLRGRRGASLVEGNGRAGLGVLGFMATTKKKSAGEGQACWPGFKRVPGARAGTKGSCEAKVKQTAAEKKADGRAAAARKREKA
jgi:hypothetical protein